MPLGSGIRYRVKQTSKGPLRLAFRGNTVVETKNLKSGKTHTMAEMLADHKRRGAFRAKKKRS